MIAVIVLMALAMIAVYWRKRNDAERSAHNSMRSSASSAAVIHYANTALYGALALMFVLSAVLLFALGENLMFMIPLTFATLAMVLYRLTSLKVWLLAGIILTLLHVFSFLYALTMALTIGAFGAVMMIAYIDLMMLIPMADIYLMQQRKR